MPEITAADVTRGVAASLWRRLLIATSTGWALGIVMGVCLIVVAESLGLRELQTPLVLGVGFGLSTQQLRALRPVLTRAGRRWILVSCTGLASPFIVADALSIAGRPLPYSLVMFVILGGVIASVLQWNVLRTVVHRASGWLIASSAGYLAAASTVWLNDRIIPKTPGILGALQYLGVILGGGVMFGMFVGLAASRFAPFGVHGVDS